MKKSMKKIDKVVTSAIIGSAVVSIFGLSRTKKWKKVTGGLFWTLKGMIKLIFSIFWKIIWKVTWLSSKKK